ncbi:sensor histidine kinase [Niabella sp. 22666]|uniref:sensor histidine kinase n=1 Tax=Niabella sp. 22666 TaxID=3453954 RepID=UPI003F86CE47
MNVYTYVIAGMLASFLLCIGTLLFYIKYRRNMLQKQFELKTAELRYQKDLLKAVINSQEDERRRIGRDLHDEVGSKLSSLRLMIENFADVGAQKDSIQTFSLQCKKTIDGVISNVRGISHNLSPILAGVYELHDAIQDFCDDLTRTGTIAVSIQIEESAVDAALPHFTKLSLYRVLTELINNTIKHAEAENINIRFSLLNEQYDIVYKDDGKGLIKDNIVFNKGIGFKNIESRLESIDAAFGIITSPGKGFEMNINLPLEKIK